MCTVTCFCYKCWHELRVCHQQVPTGVSQDQLVEKDFICCAQDRFELKKHHLSSLLAAAAAAAATATVVVAIISAVVSVIA